MFIRRLIAGILIFIFVLVSSCTFIVFAFAQTFLNATFYQEALKQPGYEFLVTSTIKSIQRNDGLISEHFTESDLHREVETVFPMSLYEKMVTQLIEDGEKLKENPNNPVTLKLSIYRESMLTLAHNLAFKIFDSLPNCAAGEIPEEDSNGLPSCIPPEVEYNTISAPLSEQFEEDIYAAVPEQAEFGLNAAIGNSGLAFSQFFVMLDTVKLVFFVILLVVLALIALSIYRPFSSILMAEAIAFTISGAIGVILGFAVKLITSFASYNLENVSSTTFYESIKEPLKQFFTNIMNLFSFEIQKGALMFLSFGIVLLLLRYYLKNHR